MAHELKLSKWSPPRSDPSGEKGKRFLWSAEAWSSCLRFLNVGTTDSNLKWDCDGTAHVVSRGKTRRGGQQCAGFLRRGESRWRRSYETRNEQL